MKTETCQSSRLKTLTIATGLGVRLSERAANSNSNDDERPPYAVLELRFAMEAITYDRAQAFKDDLPFEEYSTWQPRKSCRGAGGN